MGECKTIKFSWYFSLEDVDGGLIGGASLNANDFNQIINSI